MDMPLSMDIMMTAPRMAPETLPMPPGHGRAADDRGRDGVQFVVAVCRLRGAAVQTRGINDRRDRAQQAVEHVNEGQVFLNVDTGIARCRNVAANCYTLRPRVFSGK